MNHKPVMIDSLNLALHHAQPGLPVIKVVRISAGMVGTDSQVEDVEICYKNGVIERFSILNMDKTEAFITIMDAILKHCEPVDVDIETLEPPKEDEENEE